MTVRSHCADFLLKTNVSQTFCTGKINYNSNLCFIHSTYQ